MTICVAIFPNQGPRAKFNRKNNCREQDRRQAQPGFPFSCTWVGTHNRLPTAGSLSLGEYFKESARSCPLFSERLEGDGTCRVRKHLARESRVYTRMQLNHLDPSNDGHYTMDADSTPASDQELPLPPEAVKAIQQA